MTTVVLGENLLAKKGKARYSSLRAVCDGGVSSPLDKM